MTVEQIAAGIVAVVALGWPKIVAAVKAGWQKRPGGASPSPAAGAAVGYEEAIHNLALVRARLNATGLLGEDKSPQRAAIDTLTLALVAGSDK